MVYLIVGLTIQTRTLRRKYEREQRLVDIELVDSKTYAHIFSEGGWAQVTKTQIHTLTPAPLIVGRLLD